MTAIQASGASRVLVTHGFADALARLLRERGLDAGVLPTRFVGEAAPDTPAAEDDVEAAEEVA
jgi:putative mRNA 3-end processing factor